MKFLNLTGPQDVAALLFRRRWWIFLPFVALTAAAILITAILPKMYVSQSLIIIRPRDVPDDFVKDLIAGTADERLSVITQKVLSDSNLEKIVIQFDGQMPELQHLNRQDQILKLRQQIDLRFTNDQVKKNGQLPVTSFRITGQNHSPEMAQKIVKQLTEIFISEDRKNREANVNDTASFLDNQVKDLGAKLQDSDTKLKELRYKRRNELPNQLESNLRRLENLFGENQALRREQTSYRLAKAQLDQEMSATPRQIPMPTVAPLPQKAPPKDPKVENYRTAVAALKALQAQGYLDGHPDVQLAKVKVQTLEKDMTPEQVVLGKKDVVPEVQELTAAPENVQMQSNPTYLNMERNRDYFDKLIEDIDIQTAKNDIEINNYNQHVNNEPQGEQELTDVMRENNDLNRQYQEMNAKLAAARLSESAESQQKGAQFEIVDPASLPLTPTKPSKPAILIGGIMASLLISLSIAFAVDIANQKMWTAADVSWLVSARVLVEIPEITMRNRVALNRRKRIGFLASVGFGAVVYSTCLYFAYLHQGFVLQYLDPLIQRFY
jgi:polysaccharide chain length determinant protein (PEP-CTERM system associated)